MKLNYGVFLAGLLFPVCYLFSQQKTAMEKPDQGLFIWLLKFETATGEAIMADLLKKSPGFSNCRWKRAFRSDVDPLNRIYSLQGFAGEEEMKRAMLWFKAQKTVEKVETIPEYTFFHTPNDLKSNQWNLTKIQAEQAWDVARGGQDILVGLVDDGMDTAHSDLQPQLWHNPREIPGNGKDDDANGYVDDWFGWDMADNDNDPSVSLANNLVHGTHCAGIIGARTNNNIGIAGIGYHLKIMPIKCGRNGTPFIFNPYEGVEYCINNGTRIISMSWGGGAYSATYQAIFDYAASKGVLCIAAAGNSSTQITMYPAGYNHVIAVGSTTSTDAKSNFSNYGTWVDLMAPGSNIYSTLPGNSYGNLSGTSMACPLVSGLCALMLSKNPAATAAQVEACLKSGCESVDAVNPTFKGLMGAGRINAWRSMQCLKVISADLVASKWIVCSGDTVQFLDKSSNAVNQWKWTFPGGIPSVSLSRNPIVRYNSPGTYAVKLWVSDGVNSDSIIAVDSVKFGIPGVRFAGNQTIVKGDYGTIEAHLEGHGPWDISYTDGSSVFNVSGITYSPYFILVQPLKNTTYRPVSVSEKGCTGGVSDSARIAVLPQGLDSVGNCDNGYRFDMNLGESSIPMQSLDLDMQNDSTMIIAGYYGASVSRNALLASVNTKGKLNWAVSSGGDREDGYYCVQSSSSGSIYAGGYTHSATSTRSAVMAKYWPDGSLAWRKIYGLGSEYIYRVSVSHDFRYIYYTGLSSDQSYGSEDFTIYKLDTNGNVKWVKQTGDGELNRNHQLLESADGKDLYVVGTFGDAFPVVHAALMKLNSDGTLLWTRKYQMPTDYQVSFHDIKPWGNSDMIVYGYLGRNSGGSTSVTREAVLARLGADGSVKWAKKYTLGQAAPWQMLIVNKQIVLAGSNQNTNTDGFVMLTDSNGNVLKARQWGTAADEVISGIRASGTGEIFYSGHSQPISGQASVARFGKMGCRLNMCQSNTASVSVQNITLNSGSLSWSIKDFNRPVSATFTDSKITPSLTVECKTNAVVKPPCDYSPDFRITDKCLGEEVEFTATGSAVEYTPISWDWDFGDGQLASGRSIKYSYSTAGTYKVVLRVFSKSGNFTCLDSIVKFYRAVDSFRIAAMPADTTICLGDSLQLATPETLCGRPLLKYNWTPKWINDVSAAQPWVSPKSSQVYTVEITDALGRKAGGMVRISVNPGCCKSIARWNLSKSACERDSLYFSNISTCKSNAKFTWFFPGTNLPIYRGKNPPAVWFPKSGSYNVRLVVTDICGTDTLDSMLFVYPKPLAFAGRDTLLCNNDTLRLGSDPVGRNSYLWQPSIGLSSVGEPTPWAFVNSNISYILKVTDENGCIAYDTVQINKGFTVKNYLGPDTILCQGESIWLGNAAELATQYRWNTGEAGSYLFVNRSGMFIRSVTNKCGANQDTVNVKVDDCLCPVYIPSAFTPVHSPGLNDRFMPVFSCPYNYMNLRIYNRWGEKIFESFDENHSWDGWYNGARVPAGAYFCMLQVKGSYYNENREFIKTGLLYVLD
jgi:gliding motility-associated-like protein